MRLTESGVACVVVACVAISNPSTVEKNKKEWANDGKGTCTARVIYFSRTPFLFVFSSLFAPEQSKRVHRFSRDSKERRESERGNRK